MKKLLAIFLAALMLLSVGTVGAGAATGADITEAELRTVCEKYRPIWGSLAAVAKDEMGGSLYLDLRKSVPYPYNELITMGMESDYDFMDINMDALGSDWMHLASQSGIIAAVNNLRSGTLDTYYDRDRVLVNGLIAKYFPARTDLLIPAAEAKPSEEKPAVETPLFGTKYPAVWYNWILFFLGFGWIWMWF